ncbi:hypothetical protein [Actinoallomurus iriomotensis]|uniref:Uncharacterized protein n=1 Tax=Actinoallomurus iriomotensis TaxID=478107 RepID=A0A9W6VPK8_9ACTN|nr:hypothetical protein [Actinoallomurus iriomotensis]GLY75800.1 hypothetical protein Airi01_040670 [Actinoallomurus iriomotensis]
MVGEHAVIVHLKLGDDRYGSEDERAAVYALQRTLAAAIEDADAGEFDGNEFGGGEAVLYAYGPHAGDLFTAMEPALRDSTIRPAYAIVRYGTATDPGSREDLIRL